MKNKLISKILEIRSKINIEKLRRLRFPLITLFFVGVLSEVFYLKVSYDLFLFVLIALWFLIVKLYHFKSAATFKVILLFVFILFVLFILTPGQVSLERLTTLIYLFLAVGIFQQWRES